MFNISPFKWLELFMNNTVDCITSLWEMHDHEQWISDVLTESKLLDLLENQLTFQQDKTLLNCPFLIVPK